MSGDFQIEISMLVPSLIGTDTLNADPSHGAQSRLTVAGKICTGSWFRVEKVKMAMPRISRPMAVKNSVRDFIIMRG
jgi:hypothetical protein